MMEHANGEKTMKRHVLIMSAMLGIGAGNLPAQSPDPAIAAVDSMLRGLASLNFSPGFGVVIVRDTQIVYMKGFGYADAEARRPFDKSTVFYIGSATKAFTGLAIAALDQRGVFDLDGSLKQYLPAIKLAPALNADSITIRSLVTHTHGIGNDGPVVYRLAYSGEYNGDADLIRLLEHHPAAREGRAFNYGNIGYNVATLAMDAHTRRSWKETLQREVFAPLGLTNTTGFVSRVSRDRLAQPYRLSPEGFVRRPYGKIDANMQSAGGLVTTLEDMGKWLEANIHDGRLNGRQVIPAAVFHEAQRNSAPFTRNVRGNTQVGYALGWNVMLRGQDTLYVHGGGFPGFTTHMSFMPGRKVGVVTFANNSELGPATDIAGMEIYRILLGGEVTSETMASLKALIEGGRQGVLNDHARRAARPQTLGHPLSAYTGTFENPLLGRLVMREVNGKLEANMGAAWSAIEVFDHTKNQLRIAIFGDGQIVSVQMDGNRASALTFGGHTYTRVGG
jgi:CubicO group peptidase (beta-lactamase class C family)